MPVLLYSGGLDCTTLMYQMSRSPSSFGLYASEPTHLLVFDHGQTESTIQTITYLSQYHAMKCREMSPAEDRPYEVHIRHASCVHSIDKSSKIGTTDFIPARNAVFLLQAAAHAYAYDMDYVFFAATASDSALNGDSTVTHVGEIQAVLDGGAFPHWSPTIRVPFLDAGVSKPQVYKIARDVGLNTGETFSDMHFPPREECISSKTRNKAWAESKVPDAQLAEWREQNVSYNDWPSDVDVKRIYDLCQSYPTVVVDHRK